jgi:hypothetical protein
MLCGMLVHQEETLFTSCDHVLTIRAGVFLGHLWNLPEKVVQGGTVATQGVIWNDEPDGRNPTRTSS